MGSRGRLKIVEECFRAYETRNRELIDSHLADDFTFFAPPDPGIDRAAYFDQCWPNSGHIKSFEFVRLAELGDEVVVTYEGARDDGTRFRNTEIHAFDGDKVACVEVYFGWNLDQEEALA
jgi:hypothetical protein